ncbi:hypothetical protein F5B17DRAFT_377584 [Nemania serpens]|nr:hypothetical protein F5B17DRAFT_377584 [Nemania serpens]
MNNTLLSELLIQKAPSAGRHKKVPTERSTEKHSKTKTTHRPPSTGSHKMSSSTGISTRPPSTNHIPRAPQLPPPPPPSSSSSSGFVSAPHCSSDLNSISRTLRAKSEKPYWTDLSNPASHTGSSANVRNPSHPHLHPHRYPRRQPRVRLYPQLQFQHRRQPRGVGQRRSGSRIRKRKALLRSLNTDKDNSHRESPTLRPKSSHI